MIKKRHPFCCVTRVPTGGGGLRYLERPQTDGLLAETACSYTSPLFWLRPCKRVGLVLRDIIIISSNITCSSHDITNKMLNNNQSL